MSVKIITCTTCPVGCEMEIEYENKTLIKLTGHSCSRGEKYAEDEIVNPRRSLTSAVVLTGAKIKLMPVKTSRPIKKENLFEGMNIINGIKISAPVKMGDVLFKNFTEDGTDLVAGRDI